MKVLFFLAPFSLLFLPYTYGQSSLYIGSGTSFYVEDSVDLTIQNLSIVNHGSFHPGEGRVILGQDSGHSPIFLKGTHALAFRHLTIDIEETEEANIAIPVQVDGILHLRRGRLNLGGQELVLGTEAGRLEGEDEQHYVTGAGSIRKSYQMNNGTNHPGNMGLTINAMAPHGSLSIIRRHEPIQGPLGMGIARSYDILDASPELSSAVFEFHYLEHETGLQNALQMVPWQKKNNSWSTIPLLHAAPDSNFVRFSLTSGGDFGTITLGPSPLGRNAATSLVNQNQIELFPNPTSGPLLIHFGAKTESSLLLQLFTAQGQLIQSHLIAEGVDEFKLSLTSQTAGLYLLRLGTGSTSIFHSLIVKQ